MITIQHSIESTRSAKQFVDLCENEFENKLTDTVDAVLDGGKTKIITLSGPTCSGKTTTAVKLTGEIEKRGYAARVISIDDFYKDDLRAGEDPDLESAAALDLEYFGDFASRVLSGRSAKIPRYDLGTGNRCGFEDFLPEENDIYIFEGIQAVYPEITCHIEPYGYKSLFISVEEDVSVNGVHFDKNEVRLIRRLVRDNLFRRTGFEMTLKLWESVRKNEEINIFPNAQKALYRINSFLPYELFIVGKYLVPEALKLGDRLGKMQSILAIKEKLQKTTNEFITEDMIPEKSMLREFIG